ncbi:hypothetical protein [Actinacidiphila sp. ITFR-21]|uniref:hypothetical protein n=1 Tax=Actinacidiphila sp. ITFR-21 TaxID=3075199 RepID=UPI00288C0566|nr:hypothetical protein [Streptomyces sp. ITFR-21]WNI14591.1 hypothetical protein RLT57_02905 [Streptomyces sp. ITFR-21]
MRNHVRRNGSERTLSAFEEGGEREFALALAEEADDDEAFDDESGGVVRLACPDCGRPIAVFEDEDSLPQHALCPTPWNPFGLTVCGGSGRAVAEARPVDGPEPVEEQELAVLLTLPAELDWRTQPFSHVGGPGSRPVRIPAPGLAA